MKKSLKKAALFMLAVMTLGLATPGNAFAESAEGFDPPMSTDKIWTVTFTSDKKMSEEFSKQEYIDQIPYMQPGDRAQFTIQLKNAYPANTTWSMRNEVIKSMEENSPHGANRGAYDYKLTYTGPDNKLYVIYDSTASLDSQDEDKKANPIGGETLPDEGQGTGANGELVNNGGVGLKAATDELDTNQYFVLGDIAQGATGTINLEVSLDGETQGNSYQDTIADLKMQFGVEIPSENTTVNRVRRTVTVTPTPRTTTTTSPVKTGDYTNLLPYYIAAAVSGVILLILGFILVKRRRDEEKGGDE